MVWLATADQRVTAESGITRYLEEIRQVPMLEPHEEHMLAKRWREHDIPASGRYWLVDDISTQEQRDGGVATTTAGGRSVRHSLR